MDNYTLFFVVVMVLAAVSFITGGGSNEASTPSRGNRPVTEEMINQVSTLFPGFDRDVIRTDLSNTGSVQATIERILSGQLTSNQASTTTTSNIQSGLRNRNARSSSSTSRSTGQDYSNWDSWIKNPDLVQKRLMMVARSKALLNIPS